MSDIAYVIRYFRAVPPISPLMVASFVVLTLLGSLVTALTDDVAAAAFVPILVLQAFSASTGFSVPARRGYFDLLVVRGQPRGRIATVQWVMAALPGLCSWATLAGVRFLFHGGPNPLLYSGTAMVFLMASTIPWGINVGLPRFAAAIGWLLLICLASTGGVIWPDSVHDIVVPLDIVGSSITGRPEVALAAILLSALSMSLAMLWVHRTDIRLEAAQ